jgi:hypothetical protein
MRYALLTLGISLGIALCIGLYQGWFAQAYDRSTTMMLSEDARLAIEVRCGVRRGRHAVECRSLLKKLFLSETLDPDRVLRIHCEEIKHSPWGGGHPSPPDICVRRYGGWKAS